MTRKPAKSRTRILVVDDHPAVREALASRIGGQPDWEVCGEAEDIHEALHLIETTKPDLAVVDISLKTGNGIDLIKRIVSRNDQVRILVWSMHPESLYAERALRAGAMGYINKDQATDRIIDAVRQILDGKVYLSSSMAEKLLQRAVGVKRAILERSPIETLSDRELEVFRLIGQGVKTANIAARLHVSLGTIWTYRDRIRTKLKLDGGTDLAHFATQWILETENSDK